MGIPLLRIDPLAVRGSNVAAIANGRFGGVCFNLFQPQHILHVIHACRMGFQKTRGAQRT